MLVLCRIDWKIGNVSFMLEKQQQQGIKIKINETLKFFNSFAFVRLELFSFSLHKVTICCVLELYTIPKFTVNHKPKDFIQDRHEREREYRIPKTEDRIPNNKFRIRPLEINEDVSAAFVYSMQTSWQRILNTESASESFHWT